MLRYPYRKCRPMKKRNLCILLLLFCFILPTPVYARAGGGGGGSSGGGGSGSSGHSSTSQRSSGPYSPLANVIQTGVFCLVAGAGGILFSINLYKKKRKSQNLLNKIDDLDPSWNQDQLDQRIEETYYSVQKAWSKKDLSTLQKYLSPPLYDRWLIKLNFMDLRHEENVLKNIQLLDHKIVSVHDFQENEKDSFWVYIKGKMIDYTVDMETREIKEGSTKPSEFIEYWRFLRDKDTFVLDEIAQKEDKSLDVFTDFSENNSM